jgi:predicted CXXCH cytochrome family protein
MRRRHAASVLLGCALSFGLVVGVVSAAYASTESTYAAWVDSGFDHLKTHETPHNSYTTSTTKCAVCHAVHKAPAGGELLLRTTVGESCVYCHIDTDLGVVTIYNGDRTAYLSENKNNHSLEGGAPCSGCHSVHGANTYTGAIATKILKRLPIQPEFVDFFSASGDANVLYSAEATNSMHPAGEFAWEDWGEASGVQQTAFCTGCHPYYTRASEDPITTNRMIVNGAISTDTRTFSSHPLKRAWNSVINEVDGTVTQVYDFEAKGSTLPDGVQVALMSTNGCWRCHGANLDVNLGPGVQESSFPHYSAHRERFLISSDWQTNGVREPDTLDSRQDGTCLYCHSWSYPSNGVPPSGVGVDY